MPRIMNLLSAVAALMCTVASFSAQAPRDVNPHAINDVDRGRAYDHFERLLPLALDSANEAAAKEVRGALTDGKSPWITIAAVEAVRQAEVDKPGSGRIFLPDVMALMGEKHAKLHEEEIVPVNVMACLGVLVKAEDKDNVTAVVQALVDWQKRTKNEIVRLRHMAERVLSTLTGEDCTLREDTVAFWEWWLKNQAAKVAEKAPEKKSKTAPVVFREPIVGTRIVFVIDVSDSMKWKIDADDIPKLKAKAPHLPWDKEREPTALWLATQELAHSITQLKPDDPKKGGGKGTRRPKNDPELRYFAIVTYSKDIKLVTDGWVEASEKNCRVWSDHARDLETETLTNIHGGLMQAFGLSAARTNTSSPELDRDCVLTGAHTIVFLTDGYPTWSEDSSDMSGTNEFKHAVGNGEHVKREKLIELAVRTNRFRKVMINTVGIGNHDKELMKAFAKNAGGAYTDWFCNILWK